MNLDQLAANIKPLDLDAELSVATAEQDYFHYYKINFEEIYPGVTHHVGRVPGGDFDVAAHYFENKNAVETCFIVHGYYDHSGLYGHLIDYCLKRNLSVVIYDLPGHGLSSGEQASIDSFADYQSVFADVLAFFSGRAPGPWHVVGQSTGAAIVMDYILSGNDSVFQRTVLLAPLLRPVGWKVSKLTHSVVSLFLKRIKRNFSVNSHDPVFQDFIKNSDPLQSRTLSLRWVGALKAWQKHFDLLPPADLSPLVVQGKEDRTVDWRYNITRVRNKFPKATCYYLKEGRHHLVNESEDIREAMFSAMDVYFDGP